MIRQILFLVLCLTFNFKAFAQEETQKINFILEVDEKLVTEMTSVKILTVSENGEEIIVKGIYYPGSMIISQADYSFLLSSKFKSSMVSIEYSDFSNQKRKDFNYKINFSKHWLTDIYYVLNIYNMDNPKYKKTFFPAKDLNYLFEILCPDGCGTLVRKK